MNILKKTARYVLLPFAISYISAFIYLLFTEEYGRDYDYFSVLYLGTLLGIFLSLTCCFAGKQRRGKAEEIIELNLCHKKLFDDTCNVGEAVLVFDGKHVSPGIGTGGGLGVSSSGSCGPAA